MAIGGSAIDGAPVSAPPPFENHIQFDDLQSIPYCYKLAVANPNGTLKDCKRQETGHNPDSDLDGSDVASTSYASVSVETAVKVKKQRRAVTKKCPVCDEEIPVRLLERHVDLEAERVDEIIRAIGSTEVLSIAEPDDGFTARTRKSAVKARKSMHPAPTHTIRHA
ncbi:hypothetical protein BC629DRAFT_1595022 [Irpex lacteus]|nr:hypothetical protein BC629DRAFT_1595022 [Irpex lacteus]